MTDIIITTRQRDGRDIQHIFRLRSHQINYPPRPSSPYEMQRFSGDLQIQLDWISQTQNYFYEWFNIGNTVYNSDGYLFVGLKRKIELLTDDESTNHMFFHECFITRIESLNNENGINVINVTIHYDYYTLPNFLSISSTTDTNVATTDWVNNHDTSTNVVHISNNEVISGERTFNTNIVQSYYPTMIPLNFSSLSGYQDNITESFKNMLNEMVEGLE